MKSLLVLGIGVLGLSALCFYAEQKQRKARGLETVHAIEEVLKAQNQALAGRLFEGISRADRDAEQAYQRWKKKGKIRSYLSDTALSEPDAPRWMIVAGRRAKAAGTADDPLLEDALEAHLDSNERLALYSSKGKYYLFVNGTKEGEPFAAAYSPEAFFAAFRSYDGIKVWLALKDGTVVYHPLSRFIGSNAANLKPIAAGIKAMSGAGTSTFTRTYLGLEGKEALAAWTTLPSLGLLVGSEWPKTPDAALQPSRFLWFAIASGLLGSVILGLAFGIRGGSSGRRPRLFEEGRLDEDAMEYLEEARAAAERAIAVARQKEEEAAAAFAERDRVLAGQGALAWRASVMEEFQEKILPQVTGKQVWSEIAALLVSRSPGLNVVFYRYSPSSFSLVPETLHASSEIPESAMAYLQDARIFIGNPSYLAILVNTEAFHRWDAKRERHMPLHQTEFRAYPIQCAGIKGAMLVYFDRRMNSSGEFEHALEILGSLVDTAATFCDSLGRLLQSMYAKGSAWQAVAGASNDARNQPRPS